MTLNNMIFRRRSVRSYLSDPLSDVQLTAIERALEECKRLLPEVRFAVRIVPRDRATFLQKWRTPQFLAIFTDQTDDGLLNAGFICQQLDLRLQAMGLGTCWVGLSSLNDGEFIPEGMKLALMMAVGLPDGVAERNGAADFKRNPLAEIADAPDARLEPLRLAPSATNSQPWYVTHEGDVLHLWRTVWGPIRQRTLGRMNKLDMGIGLAHLYVANEQTFRFWRAADAPTLDGYVYVGSVAL